MTYITPVKRVVTTADLEKWIDSPIYNQIIEFVEELQELVVGLTNDAEVLESEATKNLLLLLDDVNLVIESHPVEHEKDVSRFGKVEFRDFYDDLSEKAPSILRSLHLAPKQDLAMGLDLDLDPSIELAAYFVESWGNRTRIDYGSGHEMNFIAFLLCLQRLGVINKEDYPAVVLKVFTKYISIMRTLQKLYWLEPAGSHGVWGLDDYHFLPFLFGAAQLATHPYMRPKLIHNDELVETLYKQYMYLECIHFINVIKTVPVNQSQKLSLRWHSPMLDDILSAKSWMKIKEGMIKMYKAEVMSKLPIIQHFAFGSIIPAPEGVSEPHSHDDEDDCGHIHSRDKLSTWGDCCGIKIPSAFAASEMNKQQMNYKPVPFD